MEKFTIEKAKSMQYPVYWETFYQISQIPRGTFHCEQIAAFLAKKLEQYKPTKLEIDKANNLYAKIPATKGCEDWPSLCLQGHMDMVWSKDENSQHDFTKQPLDLLIDGDKLTANKTTLGADDGTAIASVFAVLESKGKHGPLEILITADEEYCTLGASKLEPNIVHSKYALNLDGEQLDALYIGSGGCTCQDITFTFEREKVKGYHFLSYSVKNLRGGHSGLVIHQKRLNAIKWFFDLAYKLLMHPEFDMRLVSINGGQLMNAIPIQTTGVVAVKKEYVQQVKQCINQMFDEYRYEYIKTVKPLFEIQDKEDVEYDPITKEQSDDIVRCYTAMFNGVDVMNPDSGLPETSTNLGVIETKGNQITSNSYVRSIYEHAADRIIDTVQAVVELARGKINYPQRLPAWPPIYNDNTLVEAYKNVYDKIVKGKPLKVLVCPAGLEGSWFLKKNKDLKFIVNCGPDIEEAHSKNETLWIKSAIKSYEIVQELVSTINIWGKEGKK